MTRYSKATWRPLGEQTQPRMKRHDIICLHTMVGTLTGTDRMFKNNGYSGTESHFGIGGKWGDGRDGEVLQWQDTEFQADANLDGNHRIISIETGDNFPKKAADIEPWTPKQLEALAQLIAYLRHPAGAGRRQQAEPARDRLPPPRCEALRRHQSTWVPAARW
jgi:N-acetylmuramoyl-L-alanine amidase